MSRSAIDLDVLVKRMQQDLRRLPRHEWDGYLWHLCSQLVRAAGGESELGAAAQSPPADGEANGPSF